MSRLELESVGIVGATGPTGIALAKAFQANGVAVRAVSRSMQNLEQAFPDESVEKRAGDVLDSSTLVPALEGCDLVVNCIGLGPDQMHLYGQASRNVVEAARSGKTRILHVSSFWSYLPLTAERLTENHPRKGGTPWVRHRREAEDIHQEAGAAVVHVPDFFGPHVHVSTLQQPLEGALQKGVLNWIGAADTEREYAYVPDAMRTVGDLAGREEAYGQRWIIPGAGPLSGRRLAGIVQEILGREVRLRTAGPFLLRLLSWFQPGLRDFMQMVPEYVKPIRYDASKLEKLVGKTAASSYRDSIAATLDWLSKRGTR